MSIAKKIIRGKARRASRVRAKVVRNSLPRVSVFRSLNHIYVQLIDDKKHHTLASASTVELAELQGKKSDQAKAVGVEMAKKILACGIDRVVFDRGPYLFHGRVQSLAEGLKEGGITI
jgi:large subunit ribosomal protein L18